MVTQGGALVVDVHRHQTVDRDDFSDHKSVDVEMGKVDTKSTEMEMGQAH